MLTSSSSVAPSSVEFSTLQRSPTVVSRRTAEGDAREHVLVADPLAHHRLGGGEVGTGVHADALLWIVGEMYGHALSLAARLGHQISEKDLPGVVRAESLDGDTEPTEIRRVGAKVRLLDLFFLARRQARFDDALDIAVLVANDATVRVVRADLAGEENKRRVVLADQGAHARERLGAQKRRIPIHDEADAAVAVGSGERDANRIARASRHFLYGDTRAFIEELARRGALVRQDDQRPRTDGSYGPQDVRDEGAPGDRVEHLRGLRLHPR